MSVLLIFFAVVVALILAAVTLYNNLIKSKNMVQEGLSGIDVQLKRRADLIPNLIETVQGYKLHEREVLSKLTELRTQSMQTAPLKEKGKVSGLLSSALGSLWAVAENYPNLKANENFIELQKALADIEDQIQLSRRYYNGAVRNLNIAIQSFPGNVIAGLFKFTPADYFQTDDDQDRVLPKVKWS